MNIQEDPTLCPRCRLVVLVGYTGHIPVTKGDRTLHYHSHCWENEVRQENWMRQL